MGSLDVQVAIVTGGEGTIGRAMTRALVDQGAQVMVVDRTSEDRGDTAAPSPSGSVQAYVADVRSGEEARRAVAATEERLVPVDLLVNNAGTAMDPGPLWEADADEWWAVVDVNLRGSMLFAAAVMPSMIDKGRGRIVSVAGGGAVRPLEYISAYGISKAAILRLTEHLALEGGQHGLLAFALMPGLVHTALSDRVVAGRAGRKWLPEAAEMLDAGDTEPPETVAALLVDIASGKLDELSGCLVDTTDDVDALAAQAAEIKKRALLRLRLEKPVA